MSAKYITKENSRSNKSMTQLRREARHRAQDTIRLRYSAEINEDDMMDIVSDPGLEIVQEIWAHMNIIENNWGPLNYRIERFGVGGNNHIVEHFMCINLCHRFHRNDTDRFISFVVVNIRFL